MADLVPRVRVTNPPKNLVTALKLAKLAPYVNYKLGAVISSKLRSPPFSRGVNIEKTNPLQDRFSYAKGSFRPKSTHAEISAIGRAKVEQLLGSSIFVARMTKDGNWANSRPCKGCQGAILHYGIKYMYYFDEGYFYREQVSGLIIGS